LRDGGWNASANKYVAHVRGYKVGVAWIGEKIGRLKFNGRLLGRLPLSDLEELELLRLGVEGKLAGARCAPWRTPIRGSTRPPGRAHRRVISRPSAPGPATLDPAAEPKELPGG
jgi:hypothetical protein